MLKAQSIECRQPSPTSEQERFRMKQKAWTDDRCLILTKEQQAVLAKDDFETVCRVANNLYGKGVK
jgi:hypothetical protein